LLFLTRKDIHILKINLLPPEPGMTWVADLSLDDDEIRWIQVPIIPANPFRRHRCGEPLVEISQNDSNEPQNSRQRQGD